MSVFENGWEYVVCPLCGSSEHDRILESKNMLFDRTLSGTLCQCTCGLQLTNPQPRGRELEELYSADNYYTHNQMCSGKTSKQVKRFKWQLYGWPSRLRSISEFCFGYQRLFMRYLPHSFTLHKGMTLLDYGCGSGMFLRMASDLGVNVIGVDPDPQAQQAAKSWNIDVYPTLESLEHGAMFDRIRMSHVLEHLPEPVETLRDLTARLKPGGLIFISVPNANSKQAQVFGKYWIGYDMPRHLWHFSPESLLQLLNVSGLRCIKCQTVELKEFASYSAALMYKDNYSKVGYRVWRPNLLESRGLGAEIVVIAEKV